MQVGGVHVVLERALLTAGTSALFFQAQSWWSPQSCRSCSLQNLSSGRSGSLHAPWPLCLSERGQLLLWLTVQAGTLPPCQAQPAHLPSPGSALPC